jgi:uncharacterized protein YkwD
MRRYRSRLLALLCCIAPTAAANVADGVNGIRARGCDGKAGLSARLRASKGLNEVAREWSKGGRLNDAFKRTDYRMSTSSSMRVEGARTEEEVLAVLAANYCSVILDPSFTQIGLYERGRDVWVVVAKPFATPAVKDADAVSRRVLVLVNEARAQPRKCGRKQFAAVPPLKLSPALEKAALIHARDMATNNFFEHEGSDGSRPADRVTRIGYRWRTVAENVAAGASDADAAVRGWLDSAGHCVNIMSAQYQEMGVAYAVEKKSDAGVYWSQVFATPK